MLGGVEEDIQVEDEQRLTLTNPNEAGEFVEADRAATRSPARSGPATAPTSSPGLRAVRMDVVDGHAEDQGSPPRLPAGDARVVVRPAGGGRRGSTPPAARCAARRASIPSEYLPAAKLGVCKMNIDTDGRLVWTRVHREFFRDKPSRIRPPRSPGKIFMDGVREVYREPKRQARLVGPARRPAQVARQVSHGITPSPESRPA
jgi:fructose-bisphosphate aldolase class II